MDNMGGAFSEHAWINTMMQSQPIHKPISKPMKQRELTDMMARKGQQTMMLTCTNQRQLRQLNWLRIAKAVVEAKCDGNIIFNKPLLVTLDICFRFKKIRSMSVSDQNLYFQFKHNFQNSKNIKWIKHFYCRRHDYSCTETNQGCKEDFMLQLWHVSLWYFFNCSLPYMNSMCIIIS